MKILFVWTGVTSYMADSWRALAALPNVELRVIVESAVSGSEFVPESTFRGLRVELVPLAQAQTATFETLSGSWRPDVIFAGGWRSVTTRRVLSACVGTPATFCLDMPWRFGFRCLFARFVLRGFLRRFHFVYVPGASAAHYARWLGFSPDCIRRGLYAVDQNRFAFTETNSDEPRSGFLFVGRRSPEKRCDLIAAAHARYRALGGTWNLDCYGQGGDFVQAADMPDVYAHHGCLLLASSFDPWPLVALEARSAGLQVIASDRCGNVNELGIISVPYGNVEAMARAMLAVERGKRLDVPKNFADYDCAAWATRTLAMARELPEGGST